MKRRMTYYKDKTINMGGKQLGTFNLSMGKSFLIVTQDPEPFKEKLSEFNHNNILHGKKKNAIESIVTNWEMGT